MIWCIKTYLIAYVKTHTKKNKIYDPLCQTYSPQSVAKPETPLQNIQVE